LAEEQSLKFNDLQSYTPFPCPFSVLAIALFIYLLYFCPRWDFFPSWNRS